MAVLLDRTESNTDQRAIANPNLGWYFVFFVISGFCGLVYEVVWVRLAMASFGVTTALVSIVISMFMAGLGLGSWAAGRLARRGLHVHGRRMLRLYAASELLIGISSLAVPIQLKLGRQLMLHADALGGWQSSGYYMLAGAWLAITLVPWCTCMGATFPLLMAVIRQSNRAQSNHSFSYLYVANVLGALLGTLASAFILIELFGFEGTLHVAGTMNTLLAICAFWISFRLITSQTAESPASEQSVRSRLYGLPRGAILVFLFTTGLVSMGMEVVWIRQFTPYLGNVVYAFAGILAIYLLATNLGSMDYRSSARAHNPDKSVRAWSSLAFFAVIPVLAADPILTFGALESGPVRVVSIILFCALVGFLTPLLVDVWSSGDPDRAGTAYAVNIAGCIIGPLIAGFWLLPWLGERWSVGALSLPLFAIAGLAVLRKPHEPAKALLGIGARPQVALAAIAAILLISISHDFETQFAGGVVRRDYTATVVATGTGFNRQLIVNGVGMTSLTSMTKYMAHLPLAYLSTPPRNGLDICFGMGTTFRSMLSWGIPTTAVDLVPSVPKLFWYYHADASKLIHSPLAHIVIDDGRRYLDGSSQRFDVIVVDPPPPVPTPGSSLLYSREFYAVVKKHLRKGGILETWYPGDGGDAASTASITKALVESFPYLRAFRLFDSRFQISGIQFLASMKPLPITSASVLASRMPPAAAGDLVEWGPEPTAQKQFQLILSHSVSIQSLIDEDPRVPTLSDDRPINEYFLLRAFLPHIDR